MVKPVMAKLRQPSLEQALLDEIYDSSGGERCGRTRRPNCGQILVNSRRNRRNRLPAASRASSWSNTGQTLDLKIFGRISTPQLVQERMVKRAAKPVVKRVVEIYSGNERSNPGQIMVKYWSTSGHSEFTKVVSNGGPFDTLRSTTTARLTIRLTTRLTIRLTTRLTTRLTARSLPNKYRGFDHYLISI
jgi:hypothetical protein